ncbi:MAG TPA: hypothetical protein VFI49_08130 [Rudaea sp.]|nr:hypothetical protein [Rudaea sp.]
MRLVPTDHAGAIKLQRIRDKIAERQKQLKAIDSPLRTVEEATAEFMAWARQQSAIAQPRMEYIAHHNLEVHHDELQEFSFGTIALLLGIDEIEKRAAKLFKGIIGDAGVSAAERASRDAQLKAELREIEIEEERAVLALEDQGFAVLRRRDIDPAILWACWNE